MKRITPIFILLALAFSWQISAQITSYPYSEDFESGDGGWTAVNGANGTWAVGAPSATIINSADSGTNAWVTNLTGDYNTSEDSSVESPVFDFSALVTPTIELSIWWNSEFSWDGAVLQSSIDGGTTWVNVGALNDPNNWFNDDTIAGNPGGQQIGWTGRESSGNGSGGWVIARNTLTSLAGEASVTFRVAFGSDTSIQDEGFAFDTISIFEVTCAEPTNVVLSNITENSVDISWSADPSETAWEYIIQSAGTGVPAGSGTATTSTSVTDSSLSPSTAYEVYIRTNCDTNGFSVWTGPFNFNTTNVPPPPPLGVTCSSGTSSFLFSEDFEIDPPAGWTGTGFSGTNGNWDITGGNGNSGGTGPFVSFSGNTHLEYEASGDSSTIASAISPAIDLTSAVDGAELSFYMHAFGADIGTLNVNVGTSATGPFTTLYSWIGEFQTDDEDAWVPIGVNLDAYLGQTIYIEFSYGGAGTGFEGDLSIDLVRVESCGSFCVAPSGITVANITGTTADLSWTANSGESSWEYVVQLAGTGEPTSAGTTTTTTTINLTALDFSTDYEVYVLANCTSGNSVWAGPVNFTTSAQTDFSVDCAVGPVNENFCYDSGGATDPFIYTFTSTDGSPLSLTFNSGEVENGWDELVVIDTDGSFIVDPADNNYGNNGDLSGLSYVSTGDTISFYINSDGSVSCQSSTGTLGDGIDYTVACATCENPEATFAVVSDCINGPQFFVEVDLTNLGSATSITLSDDQGSTDQTVTTTGMYTFGPYANATNVVITVTNDDDVNCIINSNVLTQEFCTEVFLDCTAGPFNTDYCYPNGGDTNPEIFTFTSNDGTPLNLNFNSGEVENGWDELVVIDTDGSFIVDPADQFYGNNGDLSGLSYQSTGDTISFYINSDGIISCDSGSAGLDQGINYTVACATCINPQATYGVVDDCANGDQFLIDVDVASLGDATSLTISNNIDANITAVTSVGTYQIGPFPFLVDVIVTISNDQDVNCVINSPAIQLLACPPDNDNCDGAIVAAVNDGSACDLVTPGTILAATPSGVPNGSCSGNP
ncbi:MAG: fibronectin type III domain-containing protein, partial [Bacteroidia bacterium]|nr:fibronectin type III domain-containing protein [Bacteroidia bacterium]